MPMHDRYNKKLYMLQDLSREFVEALVATTALQVTGVNNMIMDKFGSEEPMMAALGVGTSFYLASDIVDYVSEGQSKIMSMNYIGAIDDILYFSIGVGVFAATNLDGQIMEIIDKTLGLPPAISQAVQLGGVLGTLRLVGNQVIPRMGNQALSILRQPASYIWQMAQRR